ncbi:PIN domain-containing protein [Dokdonella immobilis]|uniref:PIN domain-containing protein n=1 Tax=Dokdonella immobilis TaxID=578942 RepID=UPI001113F755|nr:PIN domain-containing protein [Dokdonella immobilis]
MSPINQSSDQPGIWLVNYSVIISPLVTLAEASGASGNGLGLQFFLIDFENVQPTSIGSLVPGHCRVMVFLGQNQTKVPVALLQELQPLGSDVEYVQISGSGSNAVDFHIAFYIGKLAVSHPDARFTIVSKDTHPIGTSRIPLRSYAASQIFSTKRHYSWQHGRRWHLKRGPGH